MHIDSDSQQPVLLNEGIAKRTYRAPCLVLYGDVRVLTQAGGSLTPAEQGNNAPSCAGGPNGPGHVVAPSCLPSDPKVKENVLQIGVHPLGIGLYLFSYKPEFQKYGSGRQFGVMADEVERVMPSAVVTHPDGFKMVDYGLLGMRQALN